jgi:hypothetical protein
LYLQAHKNPISKAFKLSRYVAKTKFAPIDRQKLAGFALGFFNEFRGFESAIFIARESRIP